MMSEKSAATIQRQPISQWRAGLRLATLAAVVGVGTMVCAAQSDSVGTVSGNVSDAQGAVIPNAVAVLTSTEQGTKTTVAVNQRGEYLFSGVKAGVYSLTISAPTFQKFVADEITVNAGENVLLDASLTLGSSAETVTVEASSTTVDTRSATIATVIDPTLVNELPVDGNNVVSLAALLPGVTNVNAPTSFTSDTGGPTYNVSGSRNNQNLFLFDGLLWNNVYYNTGLSFPPPFMLQEVSVQLNNFKAQYGRNVGSVFNAVSRSGSNTYHGTIWEYIQNTLLNASDYIAQRNPHLVQNQFGATVGGPIRRDKLFFFAGYQGLLGTSEVDTKSQTPTLSERGLLAPGVPRPCVSAVFAGMNCASFAEDFTANPTTYAEFLAGTVGLRRPDYTGSSYLASALTEINSTWTAQGGVGTSPCLTALAGSNAKEYLPNGELPSVCFNPVAVNVLAKYVPLPDQSNGTGLPYTNTYALQPHNDQIGFLRGDWNTGRHAVGARFYSSDISDTTSNGAVVAAGTTPGIASYEPDANAAGIRAGILDDRWVLSPRLLNTALVGYKRYNYKIVPTDPTTLINLGSNANDPGVPELPRMEATNRFQLGSTSSSLSYTMNSSFEVDDSLIWTKGNHTLQFGAQYLDLNYIHRYDQAPFLEAETANTTISSADFLIGLTYSETFGNSTNISAVEHAAYFYGQDDWRATSRLTLNLGMRYELPRPWFQPDGQSVTFIPGYQSFRFPNAPSSLAYQNDPGVPGSIIKTNYSNLAPRVGFAYDAHGNGRTVLRGGFGIFYDTLNANMVGIGQPYHYTATYATPAGSFSQPLLGLAAVPANYSGPASAQFAAPYSVNYADANVTEPYTEAVNIGLQQRIGAGILEAYYVGKFGRHQLIPYDLNPAIYDCSGSYFQANPTTYCTGAAASAASYVQRVKYPGFNYGGQGIVDNNTVATSNYNGLQIIYTQRSRRSLMTVVSYTYSRSLDDQSNGTTNTAALPLTPNVSSNYGPSDFQATHVLNFGWILNLPRFTGGNALERGLLNDWTFGGIFNARTGNPINPQLSGDRSLTDERPQRPPLNIGYTMRDITYHGYRHRSCPGAANPCKVQQWFNINALNASPNYGYNNPISRNAVYGPAYIETDFNLRRTFTLPYRETRFELRADAFNVFNTPNLNNPIISLAAGVADQANLNAGQIISTIGKNGAAGTNGRRVQIAFILHY